MSRGIENDRQRLDSAARILRQRITPASRFYALTQGVVERQPSLPADASGMALPFTERLSRMTEPGQTQVGDMPPQPNTWRARTGAVLVGIVRRALFWYTGQIRAAHKNIAEAAREQARALRELDAAVRRQQTALAEQEQKLDDVYGFADRLAGLEQEIATIKRQTQGVEPGLEQESLLERLHHIEQALHALKQPPRE